MEFSGSSSKSITQRDAVFIIPLAVMVASRINKRFMFPCFPSESGKKSGRGLCFIFQSVARHILGDEFSAEVHSGAAAGIPERELFGPSPVFMEIAVKTAPKIIGELIIMCSKRGL